MPIDLTETTTTHRTHAPRWYAAALALGAQPVKLAADDDVLLAVAIGDRHLASMAGTPPVFRTWYEAPVRMGGVDSVAVRDTREHDASDMDVWTDALAWLVTGASGRRPALRS